MTAPINPATEAFGRWLGNEKVWGEVLIRSHGGQFELRHASDRDVLADGLKRIAALDARRLATFTASGEFRPLHVSPDLPRGWILQCNGIQELWRALQEFYPGTIADWFAAENGASPTNYREFTNRQSGMYRITQLLTDGQAANVTRAACHARFCLKRRLWSVNGASPDSATEKSQIPCLEPCAVLLEFARKAARIEQEEKVAVQFSKSELESFLAAAEAAIAGGVRGERAGNVASKSNPRRLQLLIEKFKQERGGEAETEE